MNTLRTREGRQSLTDFARCKVRAVFSTFKVGDEVLGTYEGVTSRSGRVEEIRPVLVGRWRTLLLVKWKETT